MGLLRSNLRDGPHSLALFKYGPKVLSVDRGIHPMVIAHNALTISAMLFLSADRSRIPPRVEA